jgi:hypothetical protein
MEASHREMFDAERHLAVWRSVNDIQAQASHERFAAIMKMIGEEIAGLDQFFDPPSDASLDDESRQASLVETSTGYDNDIGNWIRRTDWPARVFDIGRRRHRLPSI